MKHVIMAGSFDDLQSRDIRRFQQAATLGKLEARPFPDHVIQRITGKPPKFPLEERIYVLESIRYIDRVIRLADEINPDEPDSIYPDNAQLIITSDASPALQRFAIDRNLAIQAIEDPSLDVYPTASACPDNPKSSRRKIIATGCFDWLHSGHIRFFEEVSELGDLYIAVGSDVNIRLLKGAGKPLFGQNQRCFTVNSIRFVKQAMICSGTGWLDSEPEIERLKPDAYAVNEDGDVPEKRDYCAKHGLDYIVLKRLPKTGLQKRSSTALRGW